MKLNRYNEFINENLNLLLEGKMSYSLDFFSVISKIDSPITEILKSVLRKDINSVANYIDVTNNNDTVFFLPDKKVEDEKTQLYKIVENSEISTLEYCLIDIIGKELLSDKNVILEYYGGNAIGVIDYKIGNIYDFISKKVSASNFLPSQSAFKRGYANRLISGLDHFKNESLVVFAIDINSNERSYIFESRLEKIDNLLPSEDFRKILNKKGDEIKIGRFIKSIVKLTNKESEISDKNIEDFVNKYKAIIDKSSGAFTQFELVEGEDIRKWYLVDNYYSTDGTLGNSCMRYPRCQDYFDIYVKNPEVCKMLILKSKYDESKIIGRALIWKDTEGKMLMDRIYYSKDSIEDLFEDYAREHGYLIRAPRASSGNFYPDYKRIISIQLNSDIDYDEYPYVDTFSVYDTENSILYNISPEGEDEEWGSYLRLTDTEGEVD